MSGRRRGCLNSITFIALCLLVGRLPLLQTSPKGHCSVGAVSNEQDGPRKLVVEVSHGLGNRLRAYSTAAALSKRTGRSLEIVWPSDVHLQAHFIDLFEDTDLVWHPESFLECAQQSSAFVVYDYLKNPVDWRDRKPVDDRLGKHLYVRTAYRVIGVTDYELVEISRALRHLKPAPSVLALKMSMEDQLARETGKNISDAVGVHIRMQGDLEKDIPGIYQLSRTDPRYAGPRMQKVAESRSKCHVKHFIKTLRERLSVDQLYFIAADCLEARTAMQHEFGMHALTPHLPEHTYCEGSAVRTLRCVQLALAEMLLLAETRTFIYSDESSFSEIVVKLGRFQSPPLSGCMS